jgi:hypothetical protein
MDAQHVTSLRINMESGAISPGSGQPGAPSAEGFAPEELANVTPYASMNEFIADTQSESYKGSALDPRAGEAFRRKCELRLAKMEQVAAMGRALSAPTDLAGQIVQADPNIPQAVAQLAANDGPFLTREQRANAYADPRYRTSEDFRSWVAARDAITEW